MKIKIGVEKKKYLPIIWNQQKRNYNNKNNKNNKQ